MLITGGAKRVGATICRRLHAAGANLMIHFRASAGDARLLQAELTELRPGSVALIQSDLLDVAKLPSLVEQTGHTFGQLGSQLILCQLGLLSQPLDLLRDRSEVAGELTLHGRQDRGSDLLDVARTRGLGVLVHRHVWVIGPRCRDLEMPFTGRRVLTPRGAWARRYVGVSVHRPR